jgi:cysteine desulfurase/selenocysteine lyase
MEEVREKVAKFINAKSPKEIIFTSGTTQSINLVGYIFIRTLKPGDEIVTTIMEHHSNFVPWQQLSIERGGVLKIAEINEEGKTGPEEIEKLLSSKTKLLTVTQASNVLGTLNPIKNIIKLAHRENIPILIDAAQSAPHIPIDVQELDCDFLAFSAHKMLGPTGVGILYAKKGALDNFPPFLYGGSMVKEVYKDQTFFDEIPYKFEAGTPNIAGIIAFGQSLEYINKIGLKNIMDHDRELTKYAEDNLRTVPGIKIYGPTGTERLAIISFNLQNIHSHDLAQVLDSAGVAVRAGHHCAMPLHERLGIKASARASFYLYNTKEEINNLIEGIEKAQKILL